MDTLTLADVLSRLSLTWYEGVSIVRDVADRMTEIVATSVTSVTVPELREVLLSEDGRISVVGATRTDEPVRRLGQLLQALLAESESPVQLRLVISQATSPTPTYRSIRELSDALAYFERPRRGTVLQALYARAMTAPAGQELDRSRTLDSLAPLPATHPQTVERTKLRSVAPQVKTSLRFTAFVAVVVLAGAAGLYSARMWGARMWGVGLGRGARSDVSKIAERASDRVGSAVLAGVSAVTDRLGLGRLVRADAAAAPRSPASPAAKRHVAAPPLEPASLVDRVPTDGVTAVADSTPTDGVPKSPTDEPATSPDQTLYAAGADGVSPPVGVGPQLLRELPSTINTDDVRRIELVVATDGTVESVKLLGPERNVHDAMLLSVVKAWRFHPALRNGVPVRFRKTFSVADQ
jgi:hypothetical protein